MTAREQIVMLERRIENARTDCAAWRASGQEEKCLEAFCVIEALELQLEQRLQQTSE